VSASSQVANLVSVPVFAIPAPIPEQESRWYAIRTRSRHEKVVANELAQRGIEAFLPVVTSVRRWSDRKMSVELPLFPGYAFVRVAYFSGERVRVLQANGVAGFVGPNPSGVSIPDEQIEAIRTLLVTKVAVEDHPFLKVGQRIRVRGGALNGVQGILLAMNGSRNLVISVEPIQRSLSIRLDGYDVEVVN
jgi:transcription antitermination factor NusG